VTKLTIEIEDAGDESACVVAIQKLYTALADLHGEAKAADIWSQHLDFRAPRWRAYYEQLKKFQDAIRCLAEEDRRLILEYYAMPRPSKRGLAIALARKNESLVEVCRYGPNGTQDPDTMLQQIKRMFRNNKEACRIVGEIDPALRQLALKRIEKSCMAKAAGMSSPRELPRLPKYARGQKAT